MASELRYRVPIARLIAMGVGQVPTCADRLATNTEAGTGDAAELLVTEMHGMEHTSAVTGRSLVPACSGLDVRP